MKHYIVKLVVRDLTSVHANNEQEAKQIARNIFEESGHNLHFNHKISIEHWEQMYRIDSPHKLPFWDGHYTEAELIEKFWREAVEDGTYDSDYWYERYVERISMKEPLIKSKWLKHVWALYPPQWFDLEEIKAVWEINILPVED